MEEIEKLIRVIENLQAMREDKSITCGSDGRLFGLYSPNNTSEVHYKAGSNPYIARAIQDHLPQIFERATELAQEQIESLTAEIEMRLLDLKVRTERLL